MVSEHVAIEIPRIVGDHDVHRGQVAVIPPRFAGEAHWHLFCRWPRPLTLSVKYEPAGVRADLVPGDFRSSAGSLR
jgi:hypothetical protein